MSMERILVVEDDPVVMRVLENKLSAEGYEVIGAVSGMKAIQAAKAVKPDLMILDLSLIDEDPFQSPWDGFGIMDWLKRTLPDSDFPVIIHTADNAPDVDMRAETRGAWAVFRKGHDITELLIAVRQALDAWKTGTAASE